MQLLKLISFETVRIIKSIYQFIILTTAIALSCGNFFYFYFFGSNGKDVHRRVGQKKVLVYLVVIFKM